MSVITLTGPTCSGKTTLEAELHRQGFGKVTSHTTRMPRTGEVQGKSYHFISEAEYAAMKELGKFVESVIIGSTRYSVSAEELRNATGDDDDNVVIVVDPHGKEQIRNFCLKNGINFISIWVDCSTEIQATRWIGRMLSDLAGKKSILSYVERLSIMLGEETEWRRLQRISPIFRNYIPIYDLSLDSGDKTAVELAQTVRDFLK